jgi:hypothetical protein
MTERKKKTKSPKLTDADRHKRFVEVAQRIGASADSKSIVPAFRRVVKPK